MDLDNALLRGADDVRTYWQTTKEWFEVPVLSFIFTSMV